MKEEVQANPVHDVLELYIVLVQVWFATNKTELYEKRCVWVPSIIVKRLKN